MGGRMDLPLPPPHLPCNSMKLDTIEHYLIVPRWKRQRGVKKFGSPSCFEEHPAKTLISQTQPVKLHVLRRLAARYKRGELF